MAHPYPQWCASHPQNLKDDPPPAIRYTPVQDSRRCNVHLKASSGAHFPRLDLEFLNSHCAPHRVHSRAGVLGGPPLLLKYGLLARAYTRRAWDKEYCFPDATTCI